MRISFDIDSPFARKNCSFSPLCDTNSLHKNLINFLSYHGESVLREVELPVDSSPGYARGLDPDEAVALLAGQALESTQRSRKKILHVTISVAEPVFFGRLRLLKAGI